MMKKSFLLIPAVALSATLAACGDRADEDTTVGADSTRQAPVTQPQERAETPATPRAEGTVAERAGDQVNDASITAEVKSKLAADPQLSALQIDVDTKEGVVTLSGPAPTEEAKSRATEVAQAADGVVRVDNQLEVRSS